MLKRLNLCHSVSCSIQCVTCSVACLFRHAIQSPALLGRILAQVLLCHDRPGKYHTTVAIPACIQRRCYIPPTLRLPACLPGLAVSVSLCEMMISKFHCDLLLNDTYAYSDLYSTVKMLRLLLRRHACTVSLDHQP